MVRIDQRRHRGLAISTEGVRAVVHDTADVVRHAKVRDLRGRSYSEVGLAAGRDIVPVDANVVVAVESVVHVMEAERVNELVHDREEAKTAGVDGVRLQTNALGTADPADLRRASDRVAGYENVIAFKCAVDELYARPLAQISSRFVNVPNVVVVYGEIFFLFVEVIRRERRRR